MKAMGKRKWNRREILAAGVTGAGLAALRGVGGGAIAWAKEDTPCALTPELTIGPYYVDYELMRSDIRESKLGVPLHLEIALRHARTCAPLANAGVDVWHCDAHGIYSGYTKYSPDSMGPMGGGPGGPPPDGPPPSFDDGFAGGHPHGRPPQMKQSDKETFLRGVQFTNSAGIAEFLTIYPGWYVSRDTHIHLEVHIGGASAGKKYRGGHVCHIGQIAFPDAISDQVAALEPYAQHKAERTRLDHDTVFHGDLSGVMLKLEQLDAKDISAGFRGRIIFSVDPEATPGPDEFGPPRDHAQG
jgi:protocatechuate 3,4-dioxygenase beta subunit